MEGLYSSNKTIPNLDVKSRGLNYTTIIVKVIKVKKRLDPLYSIKGFLVADNFHFFNINLNFFYNNNKPKVLYIFYPKYIFFNINL